MYIERETRGKDSYKRGRLQGNEGIVDFEGADFKKSILRLRGNRLKATDFTVPPRSKCKLLAHPLVSHHNLINRFTPGWVKQVSLANALVMKMYIEIIVV